MSSNVNTKMLKSSNRLSKEGVYKEYDNQNGLTVILARCCRFHLITSGLC
jgi:hypothetical protein